jgi:hypothetical protein
MAVRSRDAAAIQGLLDAYPRVVVFNATRNAIQKVGCDGRIIAHVPVTPRPAQTLH